MSEALYVLKTKSPFWLRPLWYEFERASKYGIAIAKSGAITICPRQKIGFGESEWLHVAVPGVSNKLLDDIELDLGFRNNEPSVDVLSKGLLYVTGGYDFDHYMPEEIKELLAVANGLSLFGGHLCIWGVQTQPAALKKNIYGDVKIVDGTMTDYNIWSRPKYLEPKVLVFGVYPSNGSVLYMRADDTSVYNLSINGKDCIKSWSNIGDWLSSEMERMSLLFDEGGSLKLDSAQTHP